MGIEAFTEGLIKRAKDNAPFYARRVLSEGLKAIAVAGTELSFKVAPGNKKKEEEES